MSIISAKAELSEAIAEVINLKILETYRTIRPGDYLWAKWSDDNMRELCEEIIGVLDEKVSPPEPDEFEVWLREKQLAGAVEEIDNKPVLEPPKKETPKLPDVPVIEITGGVKVIEPKESNESHAIEQPPLAATEKPVVDKKPAPEVGSKVAGTTESDKNHTKRLTALKDWMAREKLSQVAAGERAGVSGPTINMILSEKTNGAEETWLKIFKAIDADKRKVPANSPGKVLNGSGDRSASAFIQLKLGAWMSREHLGLSQAASKLSVKECTIRSIHRGLLPHANIVRQLARHVPGIEAQLPILLNAAEHQEAA